jgi:WD domain, G-beta repeat
VLGIHDRCANRSEALSRQYAAESLIALGGDELTAMRKALDAWHTAPTVEARSALLSAQMASATGYLGTDPGGAAAAVNPDGSLVAVGHADGRIRLWDTATLRQRGEDLLAKAGELILSLAFSPDGRYLAAGIADRQGLIVWEVSTGRRHQTLLGFGAVEWLPGTTTVLASRSDAETSALGGWHAVTGRRVFDLPTEGFGMLRCRCGLPEAASVDLGVSAETVAFSRGRYYSVVTGLATHQFGVGGGGTARHGSPFLTARQRRRSSAAQPRFAAASPPSCHIS